MQLLLFAKPVILLYQRQNNKITLVKGKNRVQVIFIHFSQISHLAYSVSQLCAKNLFLCPPEAKRAIQVKI